MADVVFDFTGKRYLVTGASSGMGKQIALELAQAGAKVLAIARRESELEKLRELYPQQIYLGVADVCDKQNVEKLLEKFVAANGKLNGMVHAAGISDITPLKAYDRQTAERIMDVSFWAGMDMVQLATKVKYAESGSSYVLFSSVSAFTGEKGMFAYSAAKAAVNVAVKSLAKEVCAKQHRINSIVPAWIKSPMIEKAATLADVDSFLGRHLLGTGTTENVSGVVLFLLSDRAKWITGSNIVVDGGFLA